MTISHEPLVSGSSTGTDQPIFTVVSDMWLNLRTGIVSGLNYTQLYDHSSVYTFNPDYDGQVAQELTGRADATVYETVSLRVVQPACLSAMNFSTRLACASA